MTKYRKNYTLGLIVSNFSDIYIFCELLTLVPIDYLYHLALLIENTIHKIIKPLYFNFTVYDYVNCDNNIIKPSLANIN